jgi:hypothetical protein
MAHKQIALDVSAFLDSREARALVDVRAEHVRKLAEIFVSLCYDHLGKAPRLIDAEDMRSLLGQLIPSRLDRKDELAQHVPAVIAAYLDHLEATQLVTQAFEVRQALDATTHEFRAAVESGRFANQISVQQDPFVHGAAKLGRNDPCSCGSGKKFKKCHGKDA